LHSRFAAQTRDPARARDFEQWQQVEEPRWRALGNQLDRAFCRAMESRTAPGLSDSRSKLLERLHILRDKRLQADSAPDREDGTRQMLQVLGGLRLPQDSPFADQPLAVAQGELLSPDRDWRRRAFLAIESAWQEADPDLESLYDTVIATARSRDPVSSPEHGAGAILPEALLEDLSHRVRPLVEQARRQQARDLGLDCLRPWDQRLDPAAAQRLLPWRDSLELCSVATRCLDSVLPEAGQLLRELQSRGLLDLEARPGKAPGAFSHALEHNGLSFLFANGGTGSGDLQTLIHECGHALQTRVCHGLPALDLREVPGGTGELAALGLELLCLPATGDLWGHPRAARAWRRQQLLGCLHRLAQACLFQAFEAQALAGRLPDAASRALCFRDLYLRFMGTGVDWQGWEAALSRSWLRAAGLFIDPGTAGEIGRAQLGALFLWQRHRREPEATRTDWLAALALGHTVDTRRMHERAGLPWQPTEAELDSLFHEIAAELDRR
jgi:oligoendopeptidase F